jgi:hypothetical protein
MRRQALAERSHKPAASAAVVAAASGHFVSVAAVDGLLAFSPLFAQRRNFVDRFAAGAVTDRSCSDPKGFRRSACLKRAIERAGIATSTEKGTRARPQLSRLTPR